MVTIKIGIHEIGENLAPFVIAEAGVHHANSLELAKTYITNARISGAHAIKFQTYKAERIAARWAPKYWEDESGETQFDVFASRSKLSENDYVDLFKHAEDVGIVLLSTPFDPDSAKMLHKLGMLAFKIASADITNTPLLRIVASMGKPVLLSTGASTLEEIGVAVSIFKEENVPLGLLHCTLAYPTQIADANLRRMQILRKAFPDSVIGYSDHTQPQDSELACPLAVALGAQVIEKHFTLNKALPEDDHYHAVDPQGLARLVKNCREAFSMTGKEVELTESEKPARTYARRSIVASRNLSQGTVVSADDIDFKRPGTGISPTQVDKVIGRTLKSDLQADALISLEDLD